MRTSKLLSTISVGILLIPSLALAQSDQPQPLPNETPAQTRATPSPRPTESPRPSGSPQPAQFCMNISTVTGQVGPNTDSRFNALKSDFGQRDAKVKADLSGVGQSLASARGAADTKRDADFTALTAKATTDSQKQAIATFEATVNAAITAERAAVDAADATFEKGVLADVNDRQSELSSAAAAYKAAVTAALAAAQASCKAGDTATTVRATLQSSLQTARANLQSAQQAADKAGPNLNALESARRAAVNQAQATSKTAIQQALTTLKAALGTAGQNASPSPSPQG